MNWVFRFGAGNDQIDVMDVEHYGGNQVSCLVDHGSNSTVDDYPGTPSCLDFIYDGNGNMTYEPNKSVSVTYNQLNKINLADFGNNKRIEYVYSPDGQKLRTWVSSPAGWYYDDYCGTMVYNTECDEWSGTSFMKYIMTPEGRIVNSGDDYSPSLSWEYDLKDHLGNVRVVVSPAAQAGYANVLQQTHYYPFGMRMSEISTSSGTGNRYLYNGKELQDDFGLNWYDYGARFYDPALGRWHSVDPLAEQRSWVSPYNYCQNNPIGRVDPTGMLDDWYENNEGEAVYNENIHSQKDLNDAGINGNYIGITGYSSEKSQYLSLFGEKINTKSASGRTNLKAEMVRNIDNSIINSYKADYRNNNRSDFDTEIHSIVTDMTVSMKITPAQVNQGKNVFSFDYAGGKVYYRVANNLSGGVFDWGNGKERPVSGYFTSMGTGASATIKRKNANFRVVDWIFPTTNDWQITRSRVHELLNNRKW